MRYLIEPTEEGNRQMTFVNQIQPLINNGLLTVIEKGDPIEDMKENLRRVARAVELLEKVGLDREVMVIYLAQKSKLGIGTVKTVLRAQDDFFTALKVKLK